jgi:hypothetical protein
MSPLRHLVHHSACASYALISTRPTRVVPTCIVQYGSYAVQYAKSTPVYGTRYPSADPRSCCFLSFQFIAEREEQGVFGALRPPATKRHFVPTTNLGS